MIATILGLIIAPYLIVLALILGLILFFKNKAQEKFRKDNYSPIPDNSEKKINASEVARARWIITESEIKKFIFIKYPNCQKWRFFQMKDIVNVTEWCVQITVDGVCSTYEIMLIDGEYVFKHEYEAMKLAEEEARKKAEEEEAKKPENVCLKWLKDHFSELDALTQKASKTKRKMFYLPIDELISSNEEYLEEMGSQLNLKGFSVEWVADKAAFKLRLPMECPI